MASRQLSELRRGEGYKGVAGRGRAVGGGEAQGRDDENIGSPASDTGHVQSWRVSGSPSCGKVHVQFVGSGRASWRNW